MDRQRDAQRVSAAGSTRVAFGVLGPLTALVDDEPAALGPPKQRALLAHLLLKANAATPVERIIDVLWPEDPPASARHAVQVYVSRLRRLLGAETIQPRSKAYVLVADPDDLDLGRFRRLLADARASLDGEPGAAAGLVSEALALWRGPALADLNGEPGARELVLELEEERLAALELRIEADLRAGRGAELVAELEPLVEEYPAREQLHAQLMLALYRAGRPADAHDAFERAREALLNELGLEPGPRLRELDAAIRRHDPALQLESPVLRERLHLPAQPTALVGREREIEELVGLLAAGRRLVTLTGTGGIGKTRLAGAVAERLAPQFEDGVWFVDLSSVVDAALVLPAVAQALGVAESDQLEAYLAERRLLLVLDNFEQVGDAAPSLGSLARAAPRLAVLVTSRVPLHLLGEAEYEVSALAVPERGAGGLAALGEVEAVRLFVARARAVSRGFELSEDNARDVAEICTSLGGLPLAIELASAALRELSPALLRERLEASLGFLVGGPTDAPARQQTMRATIEWSFGLLEPEERRLFASLALFRGGWTAAAAEEVCDATGETLSSLREKGMVYSVGERFSMLTPIREFALETLAPSDAAALARRHAAFFTELASAFEARVRKHGFEPENLDGFRPDRENVWTALRWAHDAGEKDIVARLAASAGVFSYVAGPYGEARQWLEVALADPPEDAVLHGLAARSLGMLCFAQGDYRGAQAAGELAVELFRSSGETELEAKSLNNCAISAIHLAEYDRARALLMTCRERAAALGDEQLQTRMEHYVLNALGGIALLEGRADEAEQWWTECLRLCERLRERDGAATALMNLGLAALAGERLDDATARFREGLRLADELQKTLTIVNCVIGLAGVAARAGDAARAGRLLGIMQRFVDDSGAAIEPYLATLFDETQATVQAELGEEAVAEAFALGRAHEREPAVAYALEG